MSSKRKRNNVSGPGSVVSSRSGSPIHFAAADRVSVGTSAPWQAITPLLPSSSDVFDPVSVAEPVVASSISSSFSLPLLTVYVPLVMQPPNFAELYPILQAYASSIPDETSVFSLSLSPSHSAPISDMSLVSTRLLAALPDMKCELDRLLSDSRANLDKITHDKGRMEEWAKRQLGFDLAAKVDSSKFSRRRSSLELLPPSSSIEKLSSSSTLKIKKTETGEFKVTSLLLSPTRADGPVIATAIAAATQLPEHPKARVNESYKSSRRGTGSKNLSRMQSKTSKATHSVSIDGVPSLALASTPALASISGLASSKDKKDHAKPSGSTKSASSAARPTIPNQTAIHVFWNYIDQYFRPIHDEDLRWLQSTSSIEANADFLVIPPLSASLERDEGSSALAGSPELKKGLSLSPVGLLTSRLLASLVEAKAISPSSSFKEEDAASVEDATSPIRKSSDDSVVPASVVDARKRWVGVEDRIRRDLSFLGVLASEYTEESFENDEICGQLRQLQAQLRLQCLLNDHRKRQLYSILASRLTSQEYYRILEDIDKQVESIYCKKYMSASGGSAAKKKKKASSVALSSTSVASTGSEASGSIIGSMTPASVSAEELNLGWLEKRKLLVESFRDTIPSRERLQKAANASKLFATEEEARWYEEQVRSLPFPLVVSQLAEKPGPSMRALAASLTAQPLGATLAIDTDTLYATPAVRKKKTMTPAKKQAQAVSI